MPKPRCSVTAAIALVSRIGSFTGTCAPFTSAASFVPPYTSYVPSTSAMKSPSKVPDSSSCARSVQYFRVLYSRERSRGWRHMPDDWWATQFMSKALNRICRAMERGNPDPPRDSSEHVTRRHGIPKWWAAGPQVSCESTSLRRVHGKPRWTFRRLVDPAETCGNAAGARRVGGFGGEGQAERGSGMSEEDRPNRVARWLFGLGVLVAFAAGGNALQAWLDLP